MEDYKPNSHKYKEAKSEKLPEKKVEKIISGSVKTKKKNELQKIAGVFVPEDVENVKSYIIEDIIVPAVKDVILDSVRTFLGIDRKGKTSTASKISYGRFYEKDSRNSYRSTGSKNGYDYDDVILDSRGEAEEVLSRMDELISTYGLISVADFYDLVGVTGNYTDNKYGWTDIRNANVIRVRDGYKIKLPRALPLN